jgi:hypothetical protein
MNIDRLFLRAIYKFLEDNDQKTVQWEDVVKSCYEIFPETFSFEKYTEWPDTWKIHNCMWRCRNQRYWILGDARTGISLTEIGKSMGSVKIEDKVYDDVKERKTKGHNIKADPKLLNYILEHSLYKKYLRNPRSFTLSESELRNILKSTMETDYKILSKNLDYLIKIINDYGKDELIGFSKKLKEELGDIKEDE